MYSTRPQRKTLTKLCPYCGKTRTYTYRDGYDVVGNYCKLVFPGLLEEGVTMIDKQRVILICDGVKKCSRYFARRIHHKRIADVPCCM